jgi:predicted ATP-grasp superfamily ATP-dependent carboligase
MENSLKNNTSLISTPDTAATQQSAQPYRHNITFDALVLDAKLRQSLVTVRSLGRHNKQVAALEVANALEQSRHVPAFASRWCQRSSVAPSYVRDVEPFLTYLQQWLDRTGARVLITSSDGTLAVLREHRACIEQHGTRIALAGEPALSIALNKDQTLEIAEKLGLGVPRGVMLRSVDEVTEAVRDVGLPAVVKPAETWQWGEQRGMRLISILVTTPEEARRAVEELTQNAGVVLFQQFLTGRREAVSFIYAHGEIYARFAQWAMRTHPQLGGTSVYRQSIPVPEDIGEQAERLVREIELDGYSEVEFRRDHLGKPYLMEINPRLSASVEVATRAGVDFPYLLYQWAGGEPIDRVEGYRAGGWMRYLEGDILATVQSFINRGRPEVTPPVQALYEFLSAFFIPSGYDYMDWQDLAPASHALCEFMDRVWYKLGKRS